MIDKLYEKFAENAIPPETPITYNDICVGHTIGNNFMGKPVKVMLYPNAYEIMRLCETAEVCSFEIRKYDNNVR